MCLVAGCTRAPRTSVADKPYIDVRVEGDRVTYRHMNAQIINDAVVREATAFCRARGQEAFFFARYRFSATQLLTSYDCRKPTPAGK